MSSSANKRGTAWAALLVIVLLIAACSNAASPVAQPPTATPAPAPRTVPTPAPPPWAVFERWIEDGPSTTLTHCYCGSDLPWVLPPSLPLCLAGLA